MTAAPSQLRRPSISRFYRNGTFIFLAVSLMVGGAIAALAFSKTTIRVTLGSRTVTAETSLTAAVQPTDQDIAAEITTAEAEKTRTFTVPSDGPVVDDYARGLVTITNAWTQVQPLAAGTRLQSAANGLIYRTTRRVDVPAGGRIDVEVVCDLKGEAGNIGPDRFTIVALWKGLQDQIYGQSAAAMTGGTRQSGTLTQAAIDEAKTGFLNELLAEARQSLSNPTNAKTRIGEPVVLASSATPDPGPGTETTTFVLRGSVEIAAVAVDRADLASQTGADLNAKLAQDEEIALETVRQSVTVRSVDIQAGTAVLIITTTAEARLAATSEIFAPERFAGQTANDIRSMLRGTPGVAGVDVRISPFWSGRAPRSPASIRLDVARDQ